MALAEGPVVLKAEKTHMAECLNQPASALCIYTIIISTCLFLDNNAAAIKISMGSCHSVAVCMTCTQNK